eukprot:36358-Pyramimonas_sp.AAC.1
MFMASTRLFNPAHTGEENNALSGTHEPLGPCRSGLRAPINRNICISQDHATAFLSPNGCERRGRGSPARA